MKVVVFRWSEPAGSVGISGCLGSSGIWQRLELVQALQVEFGCLASLESS